MIFLDPTTDLAFKKLFGDQAKKEILISFLNSVLNRKEGEKIVNVTMTNPYNDPDVDWLKLSIVDVRCVDQQGKNYIVEVQVEPQNDYPERSQYYASHAIARQLKSKGRYREVMPVIFVGILDFNLFESPDYVQHHLILNTKTYEHALRHLEFYFIELRKFHKTIDQLDNVIDKWIYLLKNASTLDKIPLQLKNPIELEEAMDALKQGNLSQEELAAYDRFVDARRVSESVRDTALQMGHERGLAQGLEESKKEKLEIARKLLLKFDVQEVAHITGLSPDEINQLK